MGNWGEAVFVSPPGMRSRTIQLTELYHRSARPRTDDAAHVAVEVRAPVVAAEQIRKWAMSRGIKCKTYPSGPDNWFVNLSSLFTFEIELVPALGDA
jgi:hypothetical protein